MSDTLMSALEQYCLTREPELRNIVVEENLYIAQYLSRRFSGRGIDYDDLYQVASLALIKALERFDCNVGVKFSTFATTSIMGEIKNYFRDHLYTIHIPRRLNESRRKIDAENEKLTKELNRPPRPSEIAKALDMPVDDVLLAMESAAATRPESLENAAYDDSMSPKEWFAVIEPGFEFVETNDVVKRLLQDLSEYERQVISERFFKNKSQRELARDLGTSQMSISRLEKKILKKLKQNIRSYMAG